MKTVLVLDDNTQRRDMFTALLRDAGHRIRSAALTVNTLDTDADLVLLGADDQDSTAHQVFGQWRQVQVPVLLLTDLNGESCTLTFKDATGKKEVIGSCAASTLRARVEQLLKEEAVIRLGALALHPQRREARWRGQELKLNLQEFDILLKLVRQPGRALTREELSCDTTRGEIPKDTSRIDVNLMSLRRKLRKAGADGLVRSAGGLGFRLQIPVTP